MEIDETTPNKNKNWDISWTWSPLLRTTPLKCLRMPYFNSFSDRRCSSTSHSHGLHSRLRAQVTFIEPSGYGSFNLFRPFQCFQFSKSIQTANHDQSRPTNPNEPTPLSLNDTSTIFDSQPCWRCFSPRVDLPRAAVRCQMMSDGFPT